MISEVKLLNFKVIFPAAVLAAALTSCGTEIKKLDDIRRQSDESSQAVTTTVTTQAPTDEKEPEPVAVSFEEEKITPITIPYTEYTKTIEAEVGTLGGKAEVKDEREGYTGDGYVSGITAAEDWTVVFEIEDSQYYDISITTASPLPCVNGLSVNGERMMLLTSDGSDEFETFTVKNRYFEAGKLTVNLEVIDASLDIDNITLTASADVSKISQTLKEPALRNENADENAKALYSYLCENYGKRVILGQYDTIGTTAESHMIYRVTGKYPAIRFGDLMLATDADSILNNSELEAAKKWYKDGGIVGYMWHWSAPGEENSYYSQDTDFNIMNAKTAEKTAEKSIEELEKMRDEGKISDECIALIKDIDTVSESLKVLRDEGIPVIWRPLHEASNGTFWWGKDKDSYVWLWKVMYKRMTVYHKLTNLIWVWSAQNADWYVGDSQCDIISADVYDDNKLSGQVSVMLFLQSISRTKPVAMSECGSFPDIQSIANEKAYWSYIGHWGANYLLTEDAELSEEFNTADELIRMYNNNLTITRDKLPDLKGKAAEIVEQAVKSDDSSAAESKAASE